MWVIVLAADSSSENENLSEVMEKPSARAANAAKVGLKGVRHGQWWSAQNDRRE